MSNLEGKTIVITGASRGIGKAIANSFLQSGMNMALIARNEIELKELQLSVHAKGSNCKIYSGSVSDELFVNSTFRDILGCFGNIDIMVNNAGKGIFKSVEDTSTEDWETIFATNTKGTFLCCKAVIPGMKQQKAGHIINIASDVAKRTFAGGSLYCASKYAQDAFSMALRKELRPFGIKVSVVYSGLVDSSFHKEPQGAEGHKDWLHNEDMANAVLYIASQPAHVVIDELMIHPLSQDY